MIYTCSKLSVRVSRELLETVSAVVQRCITYSLKFCSKMFEVVQNFFGFEIS